MDSERNNRAHGDWESDGGGVSPHLADYWQVLARRLWLILLIFAVTTASAIWAASRQKTLYQATLTLQVNDPLQRTRALNPGARISGMEIFVDPIQSEIEVLRSSTVAVQVVDSLGLRLAPTSQDLVRSDLFRDAWVDPEAPSQPLELVYESGGRTATLQTPGGPVLASGATGELLDGGFVRLIPLSPPRDDGVYGLHILDRAGVVNQIRGQISAVPRVSTNLIDVHYTCDDRVLAPRVLSVAAEALRTYGERKINLAAAQEAQFIESQLDSARVQLEESLQEIRRFKESQAFTNLSLQEQSLVNETQNLTRQAKTLEDQRSALSGLLQQVERSGLPELNLVQLRAELPEGLNTQIRDAAEAIRKSQEELRALLSERRVTASHPSAQSLQSRIREGERQLLETIRANLRVVESRLEGLSQQQQELRERQRAFPQLENQLRTLQLQQEMDQGTYQYLLSQLYQARIMEAAANAYVDVLDPPLGAAPINPRGRMNILLGALLGLILGAGAAFFLEYLDRTVRTTADVESLLGIPVLGVIPRLRRVVEAEERGEELPPGIPLVVAVDPLDPAAEAYRNLRMNLTFMSTEDEPLGSILFSSPGPHEGKSTTALNFAVILAQQGQRVLLMDADLRRPSLHRALDILREPGLTNLLVGDAEIREVVRPGVLANLDFLPSGPFPPNPAELLNSSAMKRLMKELVGKYAHVIVDSPPILAVTDSCVLGAHVDGAVVVLRSGETEQKAAERAVDQLRRLGVRILGVVLNEVAASTPEESYYLQYYYSYRPLPRKRLSRVRSTLSKARLWMS